MSEIRTNLLSDAAGTGPVDLFKQSAAKAWANLNGTGTIELKDSFNVSSAVDNGTGDYSINIGNSFTDANYSVSQGGSRQNPPLTYGGRECSGVSSSVIKVRTLSTALTSTLDHESVLVSSFGDLA